LLSIDGKTELVLIVSMIFPNQRNAQDPAPHQPSGYNMEPSVILLAFLTITMIFTAFRAWRTGDEKRDVVLIAVFGGLFAAGTAAAAIL
jgi:hypothetical protein